jgi:hypothetical protein
MSVCLVSTGVWSQELPFRGIDPSFHGSFVSPYERQNHALQEQDPVQAFQSPLQCKVALLKRLGWQFVEDRASTVSYIKEGNPCDNQNLDESIQQGELVYYQVSTQDQTQLNADLDRMLSSEGSACVFKMSYQLGLMKVARSLSANEDYDFYAGGSPFAQFYRSGLWSYGCRTSSSCFMPAVTPSQALDQFYRGKASTDCAVGLQVAEYQALREYFGDQEFNQEFSPAEIAVGPWEVVNTSYSATWGGMTTKDTVFDRPGKKVSQQGLQAMVGLTGYIGNVYGEGSLDSPNDRGENYLILKMSQAAAQSIKRQGSLGYFNQLSERAWELSTGLSNRLKKMLLKPINIDALGISTDAKARMKQIREILSEPFLAETYLFVHPLGVMSYSEHLVRLFQENPRTPYKIEFYPSKINKGIYYRYVTRELKKCSGSVTY